ncbi:aminotransferase class V-fold PLP-dependent enzyme [Allosaccharopolyspora coralli]|uniref:Aminotransferase class V-fold PLP-dependent enzyme n=2 Tax=Allosaccharopolyspora coralli TaxID=2665642 RepID=A0A5Q3QGE8_9PSEU|nr:aminotransferase class V-fold PLP-dependent enzyme [Allosaccharopolyspora coralli]
MTELLDALGGPLPHEGSDPLAVIEDLAQAAEPGLVRTNAGRYFGFVEGGVLPASLAADWLASAWDQNAAYFALSPAAAATEEVCRGWLSDLLGLPDTVSAGFTTGAQTANVIGLAAARHRVLADAGWDVDAEGLFGAPRLSVLVGAERHATIDRALRFLGLGSNSIVEIPADEHGRIRTEHLADALAARTTEPVIVCAQVGNVNTGACDPMQVICDLAHRYGAWVHVDGAFGLWAGASASTRHLVDGVAAADSWATDAHKWLNVPYDSGIAFCAHPESHRAAMTLSASYLARTGDRDGADWTPESSRRARAFAVWAALRSLGRSGVADMVDTSCAQARRIARTLAADEDVEILNDVVLNQVLARVGGDDDRTRGVAAAVQAEGSTWLGTTVRNGVTALRISVSDHATNDEDVRVVTDAVLRAVHSAH